MIVIDSSFGDVHAVLRSCFQMLIANQLVDRPRGTTYARRRAAGSSPGTLPDIGVRQVRTTPDE